MVITYSILGTITEANAAGSIVSEAVVQDAGIIHNVHRAQRLTSLYGPN